MKPPPLNPDEAVRQPGETYDVVGQVAIEAVGAIDGGTEPLEAEYLVVKLFFRIKTCPLDQGIDGFGRDWGHILNQPQGLHNVRAFDEYYPVIQPGIGDKARGHGYS